MAINDWLKSTRRTYRDALGFVVVRRLERRLSPSALYRLLWLFYTARATANELFRRPREYVGPPWLRFSNSLAARIRRRTQRYLNLALQFLPDRLEERHWRERCQVEGLEHLQAARTAGQPVVLAFFHFGGFYLVRDWLRGLGIPAAAFFGGRSTKRGKFTRLLDRLTPLPQVPLAFDPGQLRAVSEFLAGGNILLMAVDSAAVKHVIVPIDVDWNYALASGAARLAQRHQAKLLLCSMRSEGCWRFRLKLSAPVPVEYLRTEADWLAANQYLLAQIMPDLKLHPEELLFPELILPRQGNPFNLGRSH